MVYSEQRNGDYHFQDSSEVSLKIDTGTGHIHWHKEFQSSYLKQQVKMMERGWQDTKAAFPSCPQCQVITIAQMINKA